MGSNHGKTVSAAACRAVGVGVWGGLFTHCVLLLLSSFFISGRLSHLLKGKLYNEYNGAFAAVPAVTNSKGKRKSRFHILPRRSRGAFLKLLASADVVLDTYPFGGGVTTLETLSVGTPMVVLPDSRFLRGRFSYHYLNNVIRVKELIVDDKATLNMLDLKDNIQLYVDRLYDVESKRTMLRQKILRKKYKLFPEQVNVTGWVGFFNVVGKEKEERRRRGGKRRRRGGGKK